MVLMSIGGGLLGAVFGLRLNVLVLLPAIALGVLGIAGIGAVDGVAISTILIDAVVWALTLQLGYLGGLFCRFVMVATRTRLIPRTSVLARASR